MRDNLNFSLRKNGIILLFIIFIVSIILIVLVNGWILRQIEPKGVEKASESLRDNRVEVGPSSRTRVKENQGFLKFDSVNSVPSRPQSSQGKEEKNIHEIPLDSEILIQ